MSSQLYEPPPEGHVYPAGDSQDPYEDDDVSITSVRSEEGMLEDFFDALIKLQSNKRTTFRQKKRHDVTQSAFYCSKTGVPMVLQ